MQMIANSRQNSSGESANRVPETRSQKSINPALLYLASLHSEVGRRSMKSKLNVFARWTGAESLLDCRWNEMRAEHCIAFMAYLTAAPDDSSEKNLRKRKHRRGSTVNNYLAALKGVARAAWISGQLDPDDYMKICAVKQVRYKRVPKGRSLSYAESESLMRTVSGGDARSARDAAMLALMLGCGLRREEVTSVRVENYSPSKGRLLIVGKGDKERVVFAPPAVSEKLNYWLEQFRGYEPGRAFGRIYPNGRISYEKPLSTQAVAFIMKKRVDESDAIEMPKPTAHDLRRTYATRLLADSNDIVTVQKMMGHSSVTTTQQYDKRGEEEQKRAGRKYRL